MDVLSLVLLFFGSHPLRGHLGYALWFNILALSQRFLSLFLY